ncbi:MAG: PKD domain-containing protein [Marinicella sp.]
MTQKTLVLSLFLLISFNTLAQIPAVPAAFPNQSCTPGQLFYRQAGMERITNIVYHNGHIYTNNVGGGDVREFLFSDTNDPSSLFLNADSGLISLANQGNHGHFKIGDYASSHWRAAYQRVGVGVNLMNAPEPPDWVDWQDQTPAEESGSIRIFYPWSVPFNWLQYGPTPATARLYRAEELLAEWEPLGDHGIAGNSILLGNLLFITSDATMRGVAVYDISPVFNDPPEAPALVDRLNGLIGGYLGAIWQDYLVLAGGNDRDILQIVDISDPTDMRLIQTFDLSGNDDLNAGTNVPYVQTQDQYIFARRHKINLETFEIVHEFDEVGDNRPPGSVAGQIDTSQYMLPLGNLMITGGYSFAGRDAIGVWCHDSQPDTQGPYVGYHIPRDGQSNYPTGAPISLVIAEELESFTIVNGESLIVRPVGGQAIDVWHSFSHDGVLTITPKSYFAEDTTYEVIIPAGGIKDAAGNGIEGYSFSFSTGGAVSGTNAAPAIASFTTSASPTQPGNSITFTASATDPEGDPVEYRFVLGDGSLPTAWSSNASISHTFSENGHFNVKLQARDIKPNGTSSVVTETITQTVVQAIAMSTPQSSSMMALDDSNQILWVVNPDNGSVSLVNSVSESLLNEIKLNTLSGATTASHPTSVAIDGLGNAWITDRDNNLLLVISTAGQLVDTIDLGYGSRPQAVISSTDQLFMYVITGSRGDNNPINGQVIQFNANNRQEVARVEVGPFPKAMALTGDGTQLFVAEFMARDNHAVVWHINTNNMSLNPSINLLRDRGLSGLDSGGSDGPGVPNYISDLTISPDHQWLWFSGIKADTFRGTFFQQQTEINLPSSHDSTVRSVVGRIDLTVSPPHEPELFGFNGAPSRLDVDNSDSPSSITFNENGDFVFITLQGNNTVAAFDDFAIRENVGQSSVWRVATGAAPQASLYDAVNQKLWIKNFMSRDLTIMDLSAFFSTGEIQFNNNTLGTTLSESLSPDVLAGKQAFYFAGNNPLGQNDMSFEGYISCASCHIDGSHDGRVWDFTQRGEGLRNTTDLRGRRGTGHGNVHWTANFDEIQDFVLDIVNHFGGSGFLAMGQTPNNSLGSPNALTAVELDQISAYVTSLGSASLPQSPFRTFAGEMSAAANNGATVFQSLGCGSCHLPGNDFTNSQLGSNPLLHNVGTLRDSSGQRLGAQLTGIDTPTLLGVWETAPYFHDGSASTLAEVFSVAGGKVIQAETATLSDGAFVPQYIEYNQDSSSHGEFVQLPGTMTLSQVDGGSGGIGALEFRIIGSDWQLVDLNINVNGVDHTLTLPPSGVRLDWQPQRLENVNFNSGMVNTVTISYTGGQEIMIDEMIVSTADELALAAPHRIALTLSAVDLDDLLTYLNSLDGEDSVIPTDLIFENGFD